MMYSGAVDVFGSLTEKLKQQVNDTQNQYQSFIDAIKLYKQQKMDEKEFFTKIFDYTVATSAMNFLTIRVILEMKSAMDKGTSIKDTTGGTAAASSSPSVQQAGFGFGSFVGTGGTVGEVGGGEYIMPTPSQQQEPTFKPVDIELEPPSRKISSRNETTTTITKDCIVCGSAIPKQAKFCSKCGNQQ
jgi:histone deacetylase complex regulatory component SIN3